MNSKVIIVIVIAIILIGIGSYALISNSSDSTVSDLTELEDNESQEAFNEGKNIILELSDSVELTEP